MGFEDWKGKEFQGHEVEGRRGGKESPRDKGEVAERTEIRIRRKRRGK